MNEEIVRDMVGPGDPGAFYSKKNLKRYLQCKTYVVYLHCKQKQTNREGKRKWRKQKSQSKQAIRLRSHGNRPGRLRVP